MENSQHTIAAQTLDMIREIWFLRCEANLQIAAHFAELASAKKSLNALLEEPETSERTAYLHSAKSAWKASIVAHELSIEAFRGDLEEYDLQIEELLGIQHKEFIN